jgi:hypothetical protein
MRSLRPTFLAGLVLLPGPCGGQVPAPGTVLSSEVVAIPPGTSLLQACEDLCTADAGVGCFECHAQPLSDGSPGLLCERVECGAPPGGHT